MFMPRQGAGLWRRSGAARIDVSCIGGSTEYGVRPYKCPACGRMTGGAMGAVRKRSRLSDSQGGAYLGVKASARGMAWRERLEPPACQYGHGHQPAPRLAGAARSRARGPRHGREEVPMALDPTVKALMPDPSTLRDMDKAAGETGRCDRAPRTDRNLRRLRCGRRMLVSAPQALPPLHGLDARIYIPDRMTEGYGPNPAAIEALGRTAPS